MHADKLFGGRSSRGCTGWIQRWLQHKYLRALPSDFKKNLLYTKTMLEYLKEKHSVFIDPISVIYILSIFGFLYFLFMIKQIVILLILAFIIMVALNPVVVILQKKLKVPKPIAIALSYVFLVIVCGSFIGLIVPPLASQFIGFVSHLDLPGLNDYIKEINFSLQEASQLVQQMGQSVGVAFNIVTSAFNGLFTVVTLFMVSFYLMLEREDLHKKMSWFTSDKKIIERVEIFINQAEEQLGGWVRGQLLLMLTIGIVTFIGLTVLRIPYALPLALAAGLLEILPNLGPTLAAIPAIAIAYISFGPVSALLALIFYVIVQQLENNLLVPKIMAANAHVNPLVAIVTILIGVEIGGVVGAFLAIPIYIVIRLIYSTFLSLKK
ncbi:MAG: hypothetical protein COY01_01165 [Candidatus Pacebacteria bacterium CG_4_10_14_0_2_um_filter_40_20]|nr:MAG: hypothetical protein COY01_01165 [Candidatus Pacebacteria bacterium CG_4_10_14_0_2_um_filter_40_20]